MLVPGMTSMPPDDPLLRVCYVSHPTAALDRAALAEIVATSIRHNARVQVTGALGDLGDTIVQVLEGPVEAVLATLARIRQDPRHTDVQVLESVASTRRAFADWAMARLDLTDFADNVRGLEAAGKLNAGWLLLMLKEALGSR